MKNNQNNTKFYLWLAMGIIVIILIIAISWFQYILTSPTAWFNTISYEDFLIKYYTNQCNWLNFGLFIVTIVLAVFGIIFAIDYKTKKEELEKLVNDKLSIIDYVIDSYQSEVLNSLDKTNLWYEKYKSGKIIQGGNLTIVNGNRQIYFPQTFKTDHYLFFYNVISTNENAHVNISVLEKNKSFITLNINNLEHSDESTIISWYARGF